MTSPFCITRKEVFTLLLFFNKKVAMHWCLVRKTIDFSTLDILGFPIGGRHGGRPTPILRNPAYKFHDEEISCGSQNELLHFHFQSWWWVNSWVFYLQNFLTNYSKSVRTVNYFLKPAKKKKKKDLTIWVLQPNIAGPTCSESLVFIQKYRVGLHGE